MSGVVISDYWLKAMGNPSTLMVGTITALYDVGAVFGAIFAAFTAEPLGRKRTFLLGTAILIVGTVLMGSAYERVQFMVARVLTGIGIGYITSVTPVYQSEISKAAQRGWQVCCQLTTMLFGLMLAYWINYGFYFHKNAAQWRFPLLFQLVFAVYIIAITPFLPDTPRWLMRHDSQEKGMTVLARLRGKPMSDPAVQAEGDDIQEAIRIESAEEGTWSDLFKSHGIQAHKRLCLALGIQFMQQMTGIVRHRLRPCKPASFNLTFICTEHRNLLCTDLVQVLIRLFFADGHLHGLFPASLVHLGQLRDVVHDRSYWSSPAPRFLRRWHVHRLGLGSCLCRHRRYRRRHCSGHICLPFRRFLHLGLDGLRVGGKPVYSPANAPNPLT